MRKTLLAIFVFCVLADGAGAIWGENAPPQRAVPAPGSGDAAAIDIDPDGGADHYARRGDNPNSRYYVNMDFYNARSDGMLTIIPGYRSFQQTAEWSCGNAVALSALRHFGIAGYSEWDIACAMGSHTDRGTPGAAPGTAVRYSDYGTDVGRMTRFFEGIDGLKVLETSYRAAYSAADLLSSADNVPAGWIGNLPPTFSPRSLYTSENDERGEAWVERADESYFVRWLKGHIARGNIVMAEWADWDGHWVAIIGYDDNGTPGIGDDILVLADPYDTSDHWQDGYTVYPLERWFYSWKDLSVAPKPYQLQPYLVVGRDG